MSTTAAVEWELWSTRARLVVTNPGVLASARELVDSYLAKVDDAANRFRERQRDLPARRPLRRGHPLPDAGPPGRPRRWPPPSSPTATSTPRSAVRCAASATTATCSWSPATPARCARWSAPVPGYRSLRARGLPAPAARRGRARPRRHRQGRRRRPRRRARARRARHRRAGQPRRRHRHRRDRPRPPAGRCTSRTATRTRGPRSSCPPAPRSRPPAPSRGSGVRGGRDVHHIVDPRTGQPAAPVWRSVTVAADTCAARQRGHHRRRSSAASGPSTGCAASACRPGSCATTASWSSPTAGRREVAA